MKTLRRYIRTVKRLNHSFMTSTYNHDVTMESIRIIRSLPESVFYRDVFICPRLTITTELSRYNPDWYEINIVWDKPYIKITVYGNNRFQILYGTTQKTYPYGTEIPKKIIEYIINEK